ncbi:unnamed protein product [Peniophora sp. CBMAI 1063]|nr:unnamed protein product [Peniophora sp. CBMAI 1063]
MSKSPESYHYLSLACEPPITDEITLRLALQDALTATFGLVYAGAPIDVRSMSSRGKAGREVVVIRVASGDVRRITAAVTAYNTPGRSRLSVVEDTVTVPAEDISAVPDVNAVHE